MSTTHTHFDALRHDDTVIVHLKQHPLDEPAVRELSAGIEELLVREKCRQLVISLGRLKCVYSVLIARLIKLHQLIEEQHGGRLVLCDVSPDAHAVLASCRLQDYFTIAVDQQSALALLRKG